ncbi:hypothetical protein BH23CYA1_BH23CYA1_21650 [soil metagenome]
MEPVGALARLFETRYPLFILVLGAIFFLTATLSGDISIGKVVIPIDQAYDKTLIYTGISFFVVAFLLFFISPLLQVSGDEVRQESETKQSGFNGRVFFTTETTNKRPR